MANGFHGEKAEWERIERPLQSLDETLESFAARHGIALMRNDHNWPDRSLVWGTPIRRLLQIFLADRAGPRYSFWICASEDRANKRFLKKQFLKEAVSVDEIARELPALLEQARSLLESWDGASLEFAVDLRS